ncbi:MULTISPECIES: toll/interleukin-1 receptor domain-containing protein [unclassified Mesorhizobium]|uniref:toll/interleukin-1 receptor domain-containing protein n=1 Tax=unclassified Mesorhizobium TaxID=325217 RepID=UPI00112D53DE|nr:MULTISPECIES: toll/interleukin-1 receptor domain-containing protein [unclassified Mesorhizobium]TPI44958.1 toll/interleukin-1 receptor domain-containing protein [Mesorhizobium sp. B3-1-1]TPJ57114.1 toll/interleukin-1 receptor domain-containing protein [Mesorhizobium sp. B2-6-7]TPJ75530.1 toll/interleukin-1 receptor domain-containing protein [Mesorhizobium sp. B2-6-3]TPJ90209.1 toll/interleukin-1 receptor domain-containing protein [Mesorhizobium sp. B2-5-10]TPK03012.1 toll/interleukin-1 rece
MASLREYFFKDAHALTQHTDIPIADGDGRELMRVIGRVHLNFEANAFYVSFYIPARNDVECPELLCLNFLPQLFEWKGNLHVTMRLADLQVTTSDNLCFTGRIFLYSEEPVPEAFKQQIWREAAPQGHLIEFRSVEYQEARNRSEKPLAFISHDSRDKAEIAQKLAIALSSRMCPVWYDEYSLKVGDSLRESIEKGLKECRKCIFILTPNFLANGGWAKTEYQSIFTRELVEQQKVIVPVWAGVTSKDIYQYSPILADRVAAQWSEGLDTVAAKLVAAIGV